MYRVDTRLSGIKEDTRGEEIENAIVNEIGHEKFHADMQKRIEELERNKELRNVDGGSKRYKKSKKKHKKSKKRKSRRRKSRKH